MKWFYGYDDLRRDLEVLQKRGAEVGVYGKSEFLRELYFVKTGSCGKRVIVSGGIHARENATAWLVLKQAEYTLDNIGRGEAYFLPMTNPDGATLVEKGADAFGAHAEWLRKINGGDDFTLWKANARAVDLNTNFDARFGSGRQNRTFPSGESYIGEGPFSAAESRALRDFTLLTGPASTVSYHAKGRELYWYFHQRGEKKRLDGRIAAALNGRLGYALGKAFTDSAGGYKDWCIEKLGIPAFTIEIGRDEYSHLLPKQAYFEEWEKNYDLPMLLIEELYKEEENG